MEFTGQIKGITNDFVTGELNIIFSANEKSLILPEYEKLKDCKKLRIKAVQYREKRSLDANAYLWVLLQKIAEVLRTDKWSVYLQMLKRYGQFTYIVVKQNAVDGVKKQWRECEEVGEINVNGTEAVQMLCYYGSSTYDTKEMSVLIDGVVSECKELGIETLSPDELGHLKALWGVE
ncbi:MAG: hypothetical protein K0S47_3165 [Herbinix sp.]|jgi:hypothetical protein|nr:hypothetical protein [Herbinix sp.]